MIEVGLNAFIISKWPESMESRARMLWFEYNMSGYVFDA